MKKLTILILLFFLSGCEIRYVVTANFVKEFCSCLFVVKRGEKACYEQAKQFIKPSSYVINIKNSSVSAKFLGADSSVRYISQKSGCLLD